MRGRHCHIESQPTVSSNKDTKCQYLKKIKRYDTPNSHWPFADAKPIVVEVEKGWRDLIQKHHRHHHLINDTMIYFTRKQVDSNE